MAARLLGRAATHFCEVPRNWGTKYSGAVHAGRGLFGRKTATSEETDAAVEEATRKAQVGEEKHLTKHNLALLRSNRSLDTTRGYTAPADVEERVENVLQKTPGVNCNAEWRKLSLQSPALKFKVITALITEFDHNVPNTTLQSLHNVQDAIDFFNTDVKQTSSYDDLSKQDLPRNLHIELEYMRFDPETDTMFGGRTALPGSDTVVTSIKYKRKYKNIKNTSEKPGFVNHYYGY